MWCSMETVGGVKAQRIQPYIIHKGFSFFFTTKTLIRAKNREFNHWNGYFGDDFGPSLLQIKS